MQYFHFRRREYFHERSINAVAPAGTCIEKSIYTSCPYVNIGRASKIRARRIMTSGPGGTPLFRPAGY